MERHFRIPRRRWNDIQLDIKETNWKVVNVIMLCRTRTNERFLCERLFARLLPQRNGFTRRLFHVGLLADTVAVRKDFLTVLQLSPVSIIPPVIQTD
jgi:hypothetical protein